MSGAAVALPEEYIVSAFLASYVCLDEEDGEWGALALRAGSGVRLGVTGRVTADILSEMLSADDHLDMKRLEQGLCPHIGAHGPCEPSVQADLFGRCIWCERLLPVSPRAALNVDSNQSMEPSSSDRTCDARTELEEIVAALRVPGLERLIICGRLVLDDTRRMSPPDERARLARTELEKLVGSLSGDELARLVRLGREVLDESTAGEPPAFGS